MVIVGANRFKTIRFLQELEKGAILDFLIRVSNYEEVGRWLKEGSFRNGISQSRGATSGDSPSHNP